MAAEVFIDTCGLYAQWDRNDPAHQRAKNWMKANRGKFIAVTTEWMRPSAFFVGMLIKGTLLSMPELPSNEEPSSVVSPDNRRAFPESRFSIPTCSLALFVFRLFHHEFLSSRCGLSGRRFGYHTAPSMKNPHSIWLVQRRSSGRPKNLIDLTLDLVESLLNRVSVARVKGRGLN
jgi:hypothetical protein